VTDPEVGDYTVTVSGYAAYSQATDSRWFYRNSSQTAENDDTFFWQVSGLNPLATITSFSLGTTKIVPGSGSGSTWLYATTLSGTDVATSSVVAMSGTLASTVTVTPSLAISGTFGNAPRFSLLIDEQAPLTTRTVGTYDFTINAVLTAPPGPVGITIDVASGTQTQTEAGYPLLSGSAPVFKTGSGTLVLNQANTLSGSFTIKSGVAQVGTFDALATCRVIPVAGGTMALAPGLATTVGELDPNAGGIIDVGNGYVTVADGLSAIDLVAAITSGMGDGTWNGSTGIVSSAVEADSALGITRAVGWVDNGDGSVAFGYAAPGDTNLDWTINLLDVGGYLGAGKYDSGVPSSWSEGDYTYDGLVDITYVALYLGTGLFDAGPYNPPAATGAGVAAVPEPASWGMAAMATALVLARRLRCQRTPN